jgi:inward rectifier potassium channel
MKSPRPRKPATVTLAAGSGTMSLEKQGIRRFDLADPYHLAVTLSWPEFFLGLVVIWLATNLLFALLYAAEPGSVANANSLFGDFFFSIETLATVGYGAMVPATPYGHIVSAIEIFTGMVLTAMMTGLVFVRFSKPKARLIYADRAVVARNHGKPTLMIRIGNGRANALNDASARLTILLVDIGPDGQAFRRVHDLKLVRSEFHFFPLTWTLMHELAEDSPLAMLARGEPVPEGTRLMLSLTARDPVLGAQVYDSRAYAGEDIAIGMRYADAVTWDGMNRSVADMRKISLLEPDLVPAGPDGVELL